MPQSSRNSVIEALRVYLSQVEAEHELSRDDPVFLKLRNMILLRITQLESLCPAADESARIAAD
jgi:hypothetical protein